MAAERTVSSRGVTEPPVTEPPVTEPPVTEPPVTEPPVTEPPVTEPPETEPPETELRPTVADLSGAWESELLPQTRPNGTLIYGRRRFDFTDRRWTVRFDAYVGNADHRPIFTAQAAGTYELGPAWVPVPGGRQLDLAFDGRYLTMHAPDLVEQLRKAGYPLAREGKAEDVTERGALFVPSLQDAPVEYDVVLLQDGRLHLGARSPGMTQPEGRPIAVAPDGLSRV